MPRLRINLAYNFLLSLSQVLLPLISIPYVSAVLHPGGIGKVSFIDSLSYYFVTIAEFGIVTYGTREVARVRNDIGKLQKLVSELLVLHCIATGITLILYSITIFVLWQKIQDIRLVLFSVSFLVVNAFACEWYFFGIEKFRYITIRSLITRVLGLVSLFILVKRTEDYYIYYGIAVSVAILNFGANVVNLFKELPLTLRNLNWQRHIKQTWLVYQISFFYNIMIWLDNVLLGLVSTTTAVGLYALSVKIIRIATNLLTDMFLVLYPRTASLIHEGKEKEINQTIHKTGQLIILLTIPAGTGIFLLSKPLVQTLLGSSFNGASRNVEILALLPFVKTYGLFLSKQILMSYNRDKLYLQALITGSILYIFLTLGFSWYWQDAGACYALITAESIVLAICYYYVKNKIPTLKVFDMATFFQSLITAALFIPIIKLLNAHIASPAIIILLSVIICIPLYFLVQLFIMKNKLLKELYTATLSFVKPE